MQKEIIKTDQVAAPAGAYSHAVRAGNLLFLAGQVARDKEGRAVGLGDAAAQADQVMKNIGALLEAAGATFDNIVKLNVFLTDMRYSPAVGQVRRRYMREPFPASTSVQVVALADPELLLEIEAIAVL
ncbi:MAG: RidA family protein [Dehalococcoidia bacterium]|nr:RidA family protein [Dehalococcoidia bacterium]